VDSVEKKGTLDLFDILHVLESGYKFTFDDVGKLYVSAVMALDTPCLLSTYRPPYDRALGATVKKRFQKAIRSYFSSVKNFSVIQGMSKELVMDGYTCEPVRFSIGDESNIEGVISRLLDTRDENTFKRIGICVTNGAKRYVDEKPAESRDLPFRIYAEYDAILQELIGNRVI